MTNQPVNLPRFNELMTQLLGTPTPNVRKCRHGSYYPEGHTADGNELLRCDKCSALFSYDGVRHTRIQKETNR